MIVREVQPEKIIVRTSGPFAPPEHLPKAQPAFKFTNGSMTVHIAARPEAHEETYVTYRCEITKHYQDWVSTFGWFVPGAFIEAAAHPAAFDLPVDEGDDA